MRMAVDIKTLRIGSHVEYDGKRAMVYDISARLYTPDYLVMIYQDGRFATVPVEELSPVAITPDLLKELGLNVIKHGCSEHWFLGNFDLTHNTDSCYWDYDGDIRVEFLHELEDLYYLKYGVELMRH